MQALKFKLKEYYFQEKYFYNFSIAYLKKWRKKNACVNNNKKKTF